ncbi:MAG TPA: hydantoinase B/oxoprolinase family protein [Polymorphobacter sp.]|nr:hydantoinase B/oxoprolinase family protein [Polymorphobacter sp.]
MVDATSPGWEFWIDRGGTFTDVVARAPDGVLHLRKLLSNNPARYADAAVAGIRALLGVGEGEPVPAERVAAVKMGTTVATNALLERAGEPTCLAITRGLGDALRIGHQARPRLFDLEIKLPEPLYGHVVEIDERLAADGSVVRGLDEATTRAGLQAAFDAGFRALAVVLMHGYLNPVHEARIGAIAAQIGFTRISLSHQVAPLIKLVGRGDTTVVDAYLSPVLRRYVDSVAAALGDTPLQFMQSNGGLVDAARFQGKDAILSGPAGGIIGMVKTAAAAGFERLIGFDMGGTSTDVSHYAGVLERSTDNSVAGVRVRAPMLQIHTVAAGGGSICRFDGIRLRVGPESAGAMPGPACYRNGGPLTVTDCNVLLGRLSPELFPAIFGPGGDQRLDAETVAAKFAALSDEVFAATGQRLTPAALAQGFLDIAVANMARAIRQISVQRGHDLARYTLVCFGGAGGQHACAVAESLGISEIMVHPLASLLSAYGIGASDLRELRETSLGAALDAAGISAANAAADNLEAQARAALGSVEAMTVTRHVSLLVHHAGADTTLEVPMSDAATVAAAFATSHRARFGFIGDGAPMIASVRVEIVASAPLAASVAASVSDEPAGSALVDWGQGAVDTRVLGRTALAQAGELAGPLVIVDPTSTILVAPGWQARCDAAANLLLTRGVSTTRSEYRSTARDPVQLELFNNRFMDVAEQMGLALQNTATSVNIKERLDFSCAIFDASGALIANAPHMPVHLGSMSDSIRTIIAARGTTMVAGDAYMLNAPYNGGTHLPDITVVMPVFTAGAAPAFFVAARGHHADIGGLTPGSMPPASRSIGEEGVLIDNVTLVEAGRFRAAEVAALLASGAYPARNIAANIADLKAQVAACNQGAAALKTLVAAHGQDVVAAYMGHVQDHADEAVRRVLETLDSGSFTYPMDNGAEVAVRITVDRIARTAHVDFTGTSAQRPDNFNAPRSIARAAVLYVFRCLVGDDIPLNDGCLRGVTLTVPPGSMLDPAYPAAVVAGNVETSQVVTDALFGALGVMAGAQGTMNNFTFGNERVQYYETVAGGSGAGATFDGASAVQTHMTNSRLTDPEILETRFPVRLETFAIRRGSGGAGAHHGGDGVVRRVRFLEPVTAGMLANRRDVPPFGLAGGANGARARNWVERADGRREDFGATATVALAAGDVFVIETPGGGGFGKVRG